MAFRVPNMTYQRTISSKYRLHCWFVTYSVSDFGIAAHANQTFCQKAGKILLHSWSKKTWTNFQYRWHLGVKIADTPIQRATDSECQFEYEKESEISEDLKDSLSMVPLVEPINLPLCGHIFSLFFIREHFQQSSDCPLCRTTVPEFQQVLNSPSPALLRNILGKLSVTCPFKCGLMCQRMNLASHLQIMTMTWYAVVLSQEPTYLIILNFVSIVKYLVLMKDKSNNDCCENATLRRELDKVRLLLEPLQRREEEHRRREEEEEQRRREEEEEESSCLSALLIPTECYIISAQRVGPLTIWTLT